MRNLPELFDAFVSWADDDLTETGLRVGIIAWAVLMIVLAISVKNKWVLATILAYEVLP